MPVPKTIVGEYRCKADGISAFGVKLTDMTQDELLAVAAYCAEAMIELTSSDIKKSVESIRRLAEAAKGRGVLYA